MTTTASHAHASVWVAPGRLEPHDLAVPEPPDGGLLLEVLANGVCGTDLHLLHTAPPRPTVLGHEIVGRVLAVGRGGPTTDAAGAPVGVGERVALFPWVPCRRCWACDRFGPAAATCTDAVVYGIPVEASGVAGTEQDGRRPASLLSGGLGSHLVVRPGTYFWRVPDAMSDVRASLLDPMAVAVRAVAMTRTAVGAWDEVLRPDSTAVVLGAGPVGLLVTAVLRASGVGRVIVSGSRPARLAAARRIGATTVLDVRSTTERERADAVLDATAGHGADLVLDCTNDPGALLEAIRSTRRLGTVVEVGNMVNTGRTVAIDPAADICQRNIKLLGMSANPPQSYAEAMALLARTDIPFDELVTSTVPLRDAATALDLVTAPDSIKVVLTA